MNMHRRLMEWAVHSQLGDAGTPIPSGAITRRRREVFDGVETPGDGGHGEFVDRLHYLMERARRIEAVREAVMTMPGELLEFVRVTYMQLPPGDLPRQASEAARVLGVSRSTYYRRRDEVGAWLKERLMGRMAA